ncbi:MAG: hypothetical protein ACFB6S_18115 [Geminicoccaceae bacterium]
MFVDADDLVSRRLVEHVNKFPHPNGYILTLGYEFNFRSKKMFMCDYFDKTCGTCAIFRFAADDLPRDSEGEEDCRFLNYTAHHLWQGVAEAENRPLARLAFPGAVYVFNHSENLSNHYTKYGRRQRLARWLHSRSAKEEQVAEFALGPYLGNGGYGQP